jgi:hypothetical protein
MWTQMVGKVRLALAPPVNHFWHVPLYLTATGLTTSPMPWRGRALEISFDLVRHLLRFERDDGEKRELALEAQPIRLFHERFLATLRELEGNVRIWPMPVEVPEPVRFTEDERGAYDTEAVRRLFTILSRSAEVLQEFRGRFLGKCSPVHFFWGSFDLAVTRFSGRPSPPRPEADAITREAYSHEVSSAGWWPGSGTAGPAFYSYFAPVPARLSEARIRPEGAFWSAELGEFLYPYDAMRAAPDPRGALMEFLESTYEAGAALAAWNREALERRR